MTDIPAHLLSDPHSASRWDADAVLPERRTNMKITLSHRFEAVLAAVFFWIFRRMSVDMASAFMGGLLRRLGPLLWTVQKRGLDNLSLVYPENTKSRNREIVADVWESLGRTVAEFAHLEKFVPFTDNSRIDVENVEILQKLIAENKPCLFVSGHMANWEILGITLYRSGLKAANIYRAANNPIIDEKIIQLRSAVMSRHLIAKNKRSSRGLIRAMSDGLSVCMLVDQKLGDGISVPFMGHPAMTAPSTARMALKFNVPIVPLSIKRHDKCARFTVTIHDPIPVESHGDVAEDTERLTIEVNDRLSQMIHDNPGQWLWLHRRWPREIMPE